MKVRLFFLIGFLLVLTGIRWWLGANYELSPDESYHYLWMQHADISYYSKGPGVALAILAGTSLFGPTEFGVRFLSPLLAFCTSILVYLLACRLAREKVAFWSVVGLNLMPLFNLESTLITINSLSIFFWTAALYVFWLAIERSPRFSIFWPVTGMLIGLGFLCKYENAFQLVLIVLVFVGRTEVSKSTETAQFLYPSPVFRDVPRASNRLESPTRMDRFGAILPARDSGRAFCRPAFALE